MLWNLMNVGSNSDSTLSWLPDLGQTTQLLKTSSHLCHENHIKNKCQAGVRDEEVQTLKYKVSYKDIWYSKGNRQYFIIIMSGV